jgi:hypothetical protein
MFLACRFAAAADAEHSAGTIHQRRPPLIQGRQMRMIRNREGTLMVEQHGRRQAVIGKLYE